MPLGFNYAARSDVGMVRSKNEDSGYAGPHLLAMADGMGGHAGGDVASSTVIAGLVDLDGEALSGRDASEALLARIRTANADLGSQAEDDPSLHGMGTTLIALLRADDTLVLAHIGDSRAFMLRDGVVTQVTKDHSFVQNLIDEGRITSDDAKTHPQRSLVTRVLTGNDSDEPDLVVRQGRSGDRYLIASDGLTDYVARDTIDEVLSTVTDPGACADRLVELALKAGAPDNVTVVIGDLFDASSGVTAPTHPEVVGAASERTATRPIPTTPAAKAAALTASAARQAKAQAAQANSGADATPESTDGAPRVTLAEEGGPSTARGKALRAIALSIVSIVVLAGGAYGTRLWLNTQYFLGVSDGKITVFRGVNQNVGPIHLWQEDYQTTLAVSDLPASYGPTLDDGISVTSIDAVNDRLRDLRLQATACQYYKSLGRPCTAVADNWTQPEPEPSVTPSPSPSPSTTPTPAPSLPAVPSPSTSPGSAAV